MEALATPVALHRALPAEAAARSDSHPPPAPPILRPGTQPPPDLRSAPPEEGRRGAGFSPLLFH
jgi:hypothetical protein